MIVLCRFVKLCFGWARDRFLMVCIVWCLATFLMLNCF